MRITIPKGSPPITPEELCELANSVPPSLPYVTQSDLAMGFVRAAHEIRRLKKRVTMLGKKKVTVR